MATQTIWRLIINSDESFAWNEAEKDLMAGIDTSVPHSARIWNYWLGGKDNFPVDEEVGDQYRAISPGIVKTAQEARYFLTRAVRYLAGEAGIRQFLDIGTGLPTVDNTHEVAQRVNPACHVVYVDNDPLVLAHARALLTSTPEGATAYIDADAHDPGKILQEARKKLDSAQPIALMLMGILGHISDDAEAQSIVRRLVDGLPAGSYLALYDGTDTKESSIRALQHYEQSGAIPYRLRGPEQIAGFFDGLELVEPGVVQIQLWRPDMTPIDLPGNVNAVGGIGQKS
jgi:hypothetical protein